MNYWEACFLKNRKKDQSGFIYDRNRNMAVMTTEIFWRSLCNFCCISCTLAQQMVCAGWFKDLVDWTKMVVWAKIRSGTEIFVSIYNTKTMEHI